MDNTNIAQWALKYKVQRAWEPIPVDGKNPNRNGWQNERYEPEQIPEVFKPGQNIGILLGEPSGWLIDIDLDTSTACKVAPFYLPTTGCIFGRPGKARSHYFYYVDGLRTKKFQRTKEPGKDDDTSIIEIRSTGAQTIVPPGIHQGTGEPITWEKFEEPARVDAGELIQAASLVAAAAVIADAWPGEGSRQDAAMALAGGLLRGGWHVPDVAVFFDAITTAAGDEEAESRINAIKYTAERLKKGEEITGWPRLKELLGNNPVELAIKWLNLKREEAPGKTANIIRMADVDPAEVCFLWDPYIPLGKLTLLDGDPSAGKTFLALQLASCISIGAPLPGRDGVPGEKREPGNVLYLTAEDGIADTLRPRLDKMQADPEKVFVLQGWIDQSINEKGHVTLKDVEIIEQALVQVKPIFVVVDPIQGYLGAKTDMHRANEVRPVLAGLAGLGEKYGAAMLCVRHLNKSSQGKALYRGMGSIDFAAAARSILLVGQDPNEPSKRGLIHLKSSLEEMGPSIGFQITGEGFFWTGLSDLTETSVLADKQDDEDKTALEEAEEFIREMMKDGPVLAQTVDEERKKARIAEATLNRAKKRMGIKSKRTGNLWFWQQDGQDYQTFT